MAKRSQACSYDLCFDLDEALTMPETPVATLLAPSLPTVFAAGVCTVFQRFSRPESVRSAWKPLRRARTPSECLAATCSMTGVYPSGSLGIAPAPPADAL
ncbi:hypothetical protein MRB53_006618 [Persea americana]|uniref:Uncharacterized protein n=1 Tax=Persea americana TaxID=3435 RepID=A0ACC2MHG4_PERAE|nr:hypothetical protein MRB53_006618 [Persea americana]